MSVRVVCPCGWAHVYEPTEACDVVCPNCARRTHISPTYHHLDPVHVLAGRDPLLEERQKTHGDFASNAEISQRLKGVFEAGVHRRSHVHNESLDMIALKLSRILSGQADHRDHWDDIAGYAKLGAEACNAQGT